MCYLKRTCIKDVVLQNIVFSRHPSGAAEVKAAEALNFSGSSSYWVLPLLSSDRGSDRHPNQKKNLASARREGYIYLAVEPLIFKVQIDNVSIVAVTCSLAYGSE